MTPPPLTARQQQLLDFMRSYQQKHGYPPSIREMGSHMKISSTNGVCDHLAALEKKGWISRARLRSRGITIHPQPRTMLAPLLSRLPAPSPTSPRMVSHGQKCSTGPCDSCKGRRTRWWYATDVDDGLFLCRSCFDDLAEGQLAATAQAVQ